MNVDSASFENELMKTEEVVKYLGISKSTLYRLKITGQIPYYKPTDRTCYFKRSDLEDWLLSNKVSSDEKLEQQALACCMRKGRGRR